MTMKATGAALTVAEQNGKILESLIYSKAIIKVALDALAECKDADAAHRLLVKACEDVRGKVAVPKNGEWKMENGKCGGAK